MPFAIKTQTKIFKLNLIKYILSFDLNKNTYRISKRFNKISMQKNINKYYL